MTATERIDPPRTLTAAHPQGDGHPDVEEIEEAAALVPGLVLRGAEVGLAVVVGLLVCPPLAILVVVVVVPLLAIAIVVGLVAAIVAMPILLVRHVRRHHRTHRSSAIAHGLRRLRVRAS